MTENNLHLPDAYGNPQNLAESYLAMQSLTAAKVAPVHSKRAELLNEAGQNLGGLFSLEENSKMVETQRLGMRKRLAQIYTELDNTIDPVPENNGVFTRGYQKALFNLVDQGVATEQQQEEAKVIRQQNTYIDECKKLKTQARGDEVPNYQGPSFSSYLKSMNKQPQRSRRTVRQPMKHEGFFARTGKKLSSAWKTVKDWFTR